MTNPYSVLGINEDATDIEVKNAYRHLARKYHPDNYANDENMAKLAEEKMKEVNEAYDEIMRRRSDSSFGETDYTAIRMKVKSGRFAEAERELDSIPEDKRNAEWHYIKSVLLNRRGWVNDAMRELETACQMAPDNMEYQQAKEMFNSRMAGYGSSYGRGYGRRSDGGMTVCDMCTGLICADCCCECMGGDLIPCC